MQKPTIRTLALRLEQLESAVTGKRQRERLEIPDLVDVWLAPGVTAAAIEGLIELIYSSPAIDWERPAAEILPAGRAAPEVPAAPTGDDDKPRLSAGQRAILRVERENRRRKVQGRWVTR